MATCERLEMAIKLGFLRPEKGQKQQKTGNRQNDD